MAIDLARLAEDSDENREKIKELRAIDIRSAILDVDIVLREQAVIRAKKILPQIFQEIHRFGVRLEEMEPGHGPGHIARDSVNAFALLALTEGKPKEIFIGIVAGTLHDIGCALVNRYEEKSRVIRHAEVGALLLKKIFEESGGALLNVKEAELICLAIAAHTHYLKPADVPGTDGVTRRIEPYIDTYSDGEPIYALWYPRWVDRLDCVGPGFIARHYLTLAKPHQDFTSKGFVDVEFKKHMQPIFDEDAGGVHTMLGHLRMFAQSQVNSSPYGKHDSKRMIELRDVFKQWTEEVCLEVKQSGQMKDSFLEAISSIWHGFLMDYIEPYDKGVSAAVQLQQMFEQLPRETRAAWSSGFVKVMEQYFIWKRPAVWCSPARDIILPGLNETIGQIVM